MGSEHEDSIHRKGFWWHRRWSSSSERKGAGERPSSTPAIRVAEVGSENVIAETRCVRHPRLSIDHLLVDGNGGSINNKSR